jgi:hypothetical protein
MHKLFNTIYQMNKTVTRAIIENENWKILLGKRARGGNCYLFKFTHQLMLILNLIGIPVVLKLHRSKKPDFF